MTPGQKYILADKFYLTPGQTELLRDTHGFLDVWDAFAESDTESGAIVAQIVLNKNHTAFLQWRYIDEECSNEIRTALRRYQDRAKAARKQEGE